MNIKQVAILILMILVVLFGLALLIGTEILFRGIMSL